MRRLGVILVPIMLLALACGELATPETPLPPDLEATIRALLAETQPDAQSAGEPDTEATITAQVQATVQALLKATPIPSPTPTPGGSLFIASPGPTSPATPTTGPASTATSVPPPTASPTPTPTPLSTRQAGCALAADGVEVSAWVNGALAASALVQSGRYSLLVEQTTGGSFIGQTITFTVGTLDAIQTAVWMPGGATELNLTAPDGGTGRRAPDGPSFTGGPLAQPVLPHAIVGTVSVGDC